MKPREIISRLVNKAETWRGSGSYREAPAPEKPKLRMWIAHDEYDRVLRELEDARAANASLVAQAGGLRSKLNSHVFEDNAELRRAHDRIDALRQALDDISTGNAHGGVVPDAILRTAATALAQDNEAKWRK